ncbi:putative transcriptional regulatory protein [Metarhizium anisopliae]|nr:putative transcriptional regulatory protein [Metarhizium anisopliae]
MTSLLNKTDSGPPPPRQIRFVNNQGQPPSKRRRINAACLTCRRRKTRCAGERPVCSTCTKNGHQCQGYPEDSRKDVPVESLEAKLAAEDDDIPLDDIPTEDDSKKTVHEKSDAIPTPPTTNSVVIVNGHETKKHGSLSPYRKPLVARTELDTLKPPISPTQHASHPSANSDDTPGSPTLRRNYNHRVPYFRYFGPTAIVPGFKQMVVSVRDRRRSTGGSQSAASPLSNPSGLRGSSIAVGSDVAVEDMPVYDPSSHLPVHPVILSLVDTFFLHLGCNYPFLKKPKFVQMVKEKRVEPILVDAICAIGARFCDISQFTSGNDKMPRTERGQVFAQRAKHATVETFPCPSVGAVQALLLMAYEGFGANQDSALWMYLGLAIRMAVDLGLQKRVGIQYQGEKDPWYTRHRSRGNGDSESPEDRKTSDSDALSLDEQKEVEQERIDTFWAVFFLDRVISSGTGRPVTFRDDDFELPFPAARVDPETGWPVLFPVLLEIIHLYGRVSDILNNIRDVRDLTEDKWRKLATMEHEVTKMYKNWDARLQFNVSNFKAYLNLRQGTTFILLHFWFHALFIVLHQPTLLTPFGGLRTEHQLLPDSRELSMSSAKTICDILSFADLIDPISFIGNPFTSQPIYIAACAFLMESSANASEGSSRESSPPAVTKRPATQTKTSNSKHSRHSLLASAANQNYQRCYNSLQQMHAYWGGVKYILTALDQKAKGIWDCETYTSEEYESTKMPPLQPGVAGDFGHLTQTSPKVGGPPIAWSLAGTANSPNSNLTLMYQNSNGHPVSNAPHQHARSVQQRQASTPPGNMLYDPIRQSMPAEPGSMYPPAVPPSNLAGPTTSPRWTRARRPSTLSNAAGQSHVAGASDGFSDPGAEGSKVYMPSGFTPVSQHSASYEGYTASPTSNLADGNSKGRGGGATNNSVYYAQGMPYQSSWTFGNGSMDGITFDSQDIDIGALGLQQPDLMSGWLEYIPSDGDVLGLFENHDINNGQGNQTGQ